MLWLGLHISNLGIHGSGNSGRHEPAGRPEAGRRRQEGEEVRAGGAASTRGAETAEAEGPGGGGAAADGDSGDEVQAAAAEAGADQGLPTDGGRVRGESGATQAAGGEGRGRQIQGRRSPRLSHERRKSRRAHRRKSRYCFLLRRA